MNLEVCQSILDGIDYGRATPKGIILLLQCTNVFEISPTKLKSYHLGIHFKLQFD
jgi:hypothetical protein